MFRRLLELTLINTHFPQPTVFRSDAVVSGEEPASVVPVQHVGSVRKPVAKHACGEARRTAQQPARFACGGPEHSSQGGATRHPSQAEILDAKARRGLY